MDEKEQRKADAQLILEGKEGATARVVGLINELFHSDKNAAYNLRWLANQMIAAELKELDPRTIMHSNSPLKTYIRHVIKEEMAQSMANAMAIHAQQMDGKIKELKKLEKKSWRTR
jgi:ubiquinone biosynthesis protein UbiJ